MASEIDALITDHATTDHYDARDYNRVGAAVAYVAGLLNSTYGFNVTVTAKHDWTEADIPTQSDIDRYLADIQTCRDAFAQLASTPDAPTVMRYNVDTANAIEKILADVDALIASLQVVFVHSAQQIVNCGSLVMYIPPQSLALRGSDGAILCGSDGTILTASQE